MNDIPSYQHDYVYHLCDRCLDLDDFESKWHHSESGYLYFPGKEIPCYAFNSISSYACHTCKSCCIALLDRHYLLKFNETTKINLDWANHILIILYKNILNIEKKLCYLNGGNRELYDPSIIRHYYIDNEVIELQKQDEIKWINQKTESTVIYIGAPIFTGQESSSMLKDYSDLKEWQEKHISSKYSNIDRNNPMSKIPNLSDDCHMTCKGPPAHE